MIRKKWRRDWGARAVSPEWKEHVDRLEAIVSLRTDLENLTKIREVMDSYNTEDFEAEEWLDGEIRRVTASLHRLECIVTGREPPPKNPVEEAKVDSPDDETGAVVTAPSGVERATVPLNDSCDAMNAALILSCRSADFNVAEIAAQGDSLGDTVISSMRLLDRIKVVGRDGVLYTVTYLKTTTGQDVKGEFLPTGVTLQVERKQ